MHEQNEDLAWSLYWAADRLHSCVASDAKEDQDVLNTIWQEFARHLSDNAKVLDLATGNGAVPAALLSESPDLQIDAVDQADIKPDKYLSNYPNLKSVHFHANTDINKLSFEHHSFDVICSQFGVEYAGLCEATENILKYLKPGGSLLFLIHHQDSSVIQSSQVKILEMEELLQSEGLLEQLDKFLKTEIPFSQLESFGQKFLDSKALRTAEISGQVFAGINQIVTSLQADPKTAGMLGETLRFKFIGEYQRLCQMKNSAQSEEQMDEFKQLVLSKGVDINKHEPVYADKATNDYLLAWMIEGRLSDEFAN